VPAGRNDCGVWPRTRTSSPRASRYGHRRRPISPVPRQPRFDAGVCLLRRRSCLDLEDALHAHRRVAGYRAFVCDHRLGASGARRPPRPAAARDLIRKRSLRRRAVGVRRAAGRRARVRD
jgi:hypothetical protein